MRVDFVTAYPEEVERAKREGWQIILPVGTVEYHSTHCPYGCDGLVAEGMANELSKKLDCLILPTVWYGVSSYAVGGPEKNTINMDVDVLEAYVYNILKSLFKSGFTRNISILLYHQSEDYLPTALACMKAAKKLTFEYLEEVQGYGWWGGKQNADFYKNLSAKDNPWNFIRVFNGMGVGEGDHAGKHECAMLEALMPGSIKLERLDMTDDWFAENAREMSVEAGRQVVDAAIAKICAALCPEKYGEN